MCEIAIMHDSPKATWSTRRLIQAAKSLGCRVIYALLQYISGCLKCDCDVLYRGRCFEPEAGILRSIGRFPTVDLLFKRLSILVTLAQKIPIINNPASIVVARDKYLSLKILEQHGLPTPKTLVTEDPYEALKFVESVGRAVIKPLMGTMGLGSFKVEDIDTAYRVISLISSLKQPIYVQEYVEKKGDRDIRVFVVDGEVVAAAYRVAKPGSWKTNVAQGARTEPARIASDVAEIAIKATEALNLCYAGVDIAETSNGYVVFEVNASPLWRGLYEATGVDPSTAIVKALLKTVKRGYGCGWTKDTRVMEEVKLRDRGLHSLDTIYSLSR